MRFFFYTLYAVASLAFFSVAMLDGIPSVGAKLSMLLAAASFLALIGSISPARRSPAGSGPRGRR